VKVIERWKEDGQISGAHVLQTLNNLELVVLKYCFGYAGVRHAKLHVV
jgi:hypothetical protein